MSDGKNPVSPFDFNRQSTYVAPVHVAVLCPPGAAITVLLNKMVQHGGVFVALQNVAMQAGSLSKLNGQANTVNCPLLVFSIQRRDFEAWMGVRYDDLGVYQMVDIMAGKIGAS
jgi:hypothetical protein